MLIKTQNILGRLSSKTNNFKMQKIVSTLESHEQEKTKQAPETDSWRDQENHG